MVGNRFDLTLPIFKHWNSVFNEYGYEVVNEHYYSSKYAEDCISIVPINIEKPYSQYYYPCIVHGGAKGADTCAATYAKDKNIETKVFLPDWDKHGKKAGILRNIEMFEYASQFQNRGCVVFWDGKSKGTKNDIELSKKYNVLLRIVKFG